MAKEYKQKDNEHKDKALAYDPVSFSHSPEFASSFGPNRYFWQAQEI